MAHDDSFDPEEHEAREVAAEAGRSHEEFLSLLPHYYRGEVGQMSTHLSRLDLTTDWAIALLTAVLALSFGSVDSPPYFLLLGMLALIMFLLFDLRRYRTYDATRSRVRLIEENVFANAFDPVVTVHRDWRKEIGDDLQKPTLKVSVWEALSRRLKRVYLPLLTSRWLRPRSRGFTFEEPTPSLYTSQRPLANLRFRASRPTSRTRNA